MEKKNTLLLTVIAVATLLVAVVGATFAYFGSFQTTVDSKAGVNVTTEAAKSSAFLTEAAQLKLNVAGAEMLKGDGAASSVGTYDGDKATLTVKLNATDPKTKTTCTYDIYYMYDAGSAVYGAEVTPVTAGTEGKEFTYTLTPSTGITVETTYATTGETGEPVEKDFSVFKNATDEVKVAHGSIEVSNGDASQTLDVNVKFYNFPTIDQTKLSEKSFAGKFYVKKESVVCGTTKVGA